MAFLATPALVAMAGGSILDAVGNLAVGPFIPYPTALLPAYQYLFSNPKTPVSGLILHFHEVSGLADVLSHVGNFIFHIRKTFSDIGNNVGHMGDDVSHIGNQVSLRKR